MGARGSTTFTRQRGRVGMEACSLISARLGLFYRGCNLNSYALTKMRMRLRNNIHVARALGTLYPRTRQGHSGGWVARWLLD